MKKKIQDQENDFNVSDVKIQELIPNTFDNCVVTIYEGHHTLDMPTTMTGLVFSNWLKTKGGVFSKDVFRYSYNKPHGKYILYEGFGQKFIARLIEEDEVLMFEILKLIDGHLKDKPYMLLLNLKEGESLTNSKRYIIEEKLEETQNELDTTTPEQIDDETVEYNSISLFE